MPETLLLGAVAFLQFFRLGIGEILPWDESLYLVRAQAIQKFGCWLDQTPYAIGGLYSSTHPPLAIWMMTFVRMSLGNGVFASRLVAAVSGVVVLYFFWRLSGKLFSRWTSVMVTASLCSAQSILWYSHHAQLDISMFAFIIAAAYYAIKAFDSSLERKYLVIAGILYGCALSTKAFQGFYLLPLILALPYVYRVQSPVKPLAILLGSAFVVAAPWFIFMLYSHPEFYSDYAGLVGSMKTGSYSKELKSEWWYYINQVIINFPLLVLGVVAVPGLIRKFKYAATPKERLLQVVVLWFGGMLVFMSSFQTRLAHFALFLFLPASLLLCHVLEEILTSPRRKGDYLLLPVLLIPTVIWTGSELLRKTIKEHALYRMQSDLIPIVIIVILTLVITGGFLLYSRPSKIVLLLFATVTFLVCADIYRWGSRRDSTFTDGAAQVAEVLSSSSEIHSVAAFQDGTPHEMLLPQLNYYSDGVLLGWDRKHQGLTKTWAEIDTLIARDSVPRTDAAVIYVSWDAFYEPTRDARDLLFRMDSGLRSRYTHVLNTKKYRLYWERKIF